MRIEEGFKERILKRILNLLDDPAKLSIFRKRISKNKELSSVVDDVVLATKNLEKTIQFISKQDDMFDDMMDYLNKR